MSHRRSQTALIVAALALQTSGGRADETREGAAVSAYFAVGVEAGIVDRAVQYRELADEALAAGDGEDATRYMAMACTFESIASWDAALSAPICARARRRAEELGPLDARVGLLSLEGTLLAWRLDVAGSFARLNEALELGAQLDPRDPDSGGVRAARCTRGALSLELAQWDAALRDLETSRRDSVAAGDQAMVAWADTWLCRAHRLLGDLDEARARCGAARAYIDRTNDAHVAQMLPWVEGDLEDELGRHAEALARYREGAVRAAEPGGQILRLTYAIIIVHELIILGAVDEASASITDLERAIEAGELPATAGPQIARQRGRLEMARGDVTAAIDAFERAAQSTMHGVAVLSHAELADARRAAGDLSGAREAVEGAIALIEAGRLQIDGAERRIHYASLHADLYRDLVGLLWDEQGAGAGAQALGVCEAGRARALADALALADVAGAAAPPMRIERIQESLAEGHVLVEYVTGEQTYAVAASRRHIAFVALPFGADEIARRVSYFRQLVQEAASDEEIIEPGAALWTDLFAPVLAALPGGGAELDTLIVSPDGPLYELPIDALYTGAGFVVDHWKTAIVPSASALVARAARHSSGALVIAASGKNGSLDPLPHAHAEAAAARRRLRAVDVREGAAATEAVAAGAGAYAIVHFASHAVIDPGQPLRSALVLAADADGDGQWRAEEIYDSDLSADLVVLSACRTAIGRLARGEGPMSLSRAFLHAGAQATVATLWDLDDPVGPAFADALYARLGRGATLVDAVSDARRALRESGAPPRAWAAYVLTGPPNGHVHAQAPPARRRAGWPGAVLLVAAALVLLGAFAAIARARRTARPV